MSVVKKDYFTVCSDIGPTDHPAGDPSLVNTGPVATARFPDWFIMAPPKYKKIVRVLGATANMIDNDNDSSSERALDLGFRLFSNIATHSNITLMSADVQTYPQKLIFGKAGFVMMLNNYNSTKEYDLTYENINEVQFFLRPWNSWTGWIHTIDLVCELELLLVEE